MYNSLYFPSQGMEWFLWLDGKQYYQPPTNLPTHAHTHAHTWARTHTRQLMRWHTAQNPLLMFEKITRNGTLVKSQTLREAKCYNASSLVALMSVPWGNTYSYVLREKIGRLSFRSQLFCWKKLHIVLIGKFWPQFEIGGKHKKFCHALILFYLWSC